MGGPSIMMQYAAMKAARANGVTVLLDGQGGDETLLGYDRHYAALLRASFRDGGIPASIAALRSALTANANLSLRRLAVIFAGMSWAKARSLGYRRHYGFLKNRALASSLQRLLNAREGAAMQAVEIAETSLPMLLRFEDKNSAHFGIEARLPYLDHRFVEFALGLPVRVKMNDGWSKWPLRQAMANRLPESICWRRNKIAFAAPDELWLDRHHSRMRQKVLGCELLARHVDLKALAGRLDRLQLPMRWRLYCLALWSEQFGIGA